ncbi:hypothetical protein PC9H_010485 [Pleurotus ostreatus]|uniref:pectinesterase n=1 Tax=Pleurotus ostreatus TaxID=5322 RepID=A0A8H6ZM53_PLEOS|nr:uncharacterized protein PC9H_010485 [Pleurotus ostreatus]KAF7422329.1 hypothetical protein PC9H_010485 [Pleurotus ostreatus]
MFSKSTKFFLAFLAVSLPNMVTGREQWLERDGRAVQLYPRRFGQENPPVIAKLSAACPGQICGVLAGAAITPLLAAQPECSQQDHADAIIDAAKQFDAATQANMIALAIEYRQAEKNTPPDFTTNPPTPRNSVFCQKAPKNPELNGLVQAQDPANDPTIFFDPATKATVRLGDQPNTFPFGQAGGAAPAPAPAVTAAPEAPAPEASPAPETPAPETPAAPAPATGAIGNFGSCSVPQIEFAAGFDNRRETSFRPVDLTSFNHGSAQNPDIIMQFVCDTLVNSCGADQTARTTCATARAAANAAQPAKTGIVADTFNAGFGISTNFAAVQALDNQGAPFGPIVAAPATPAPAPAPAPDASTPATPDTPVVSPPAAGGIGDFGRCTVPQIEFGVGFDNRRETSFRPVDLTNFNHGSAQNINIITRFVCDQLVNFCGADQTARATCATAITAASSAEPAKTGIQADAFNAVFGITTNFASVQAFDDQGRPFGPTGNTAPATPAPAPAPAPATPAAPAPAPVNNAGNLQTFTGALGGVKAPIVTAVGNAFQVENNASFNNLNSALRRSCDVQNRADPFAQFHSIQDAIQALPDSGSFVILVGAGEYHETINITRRGPLTLVGQIAAEASLPSTRTANISESNLVQIWDNKFVVPGMDDADSAVLSVAPSRDAALIGAGPTGAPLQPLSGNADFKAYNIDFQNRAANFSISQALVTDISYANASFYGCSFASYQDTWYTGRNASTYVVDSVIFGQTDYLFGFGTAWFEDVVLANRACGGGIVAWKGTNQTDAPGNRYGAYVSNSRIARSPDANTTVVTADRCFLGENIGLPF